MDQVGKGGPRVIVCDEDRRLKILGLGGQVLSQMQNASKGLVVLMKAQKVWEARQVDVKGAARGADTAVSSFL